MPQSQLNSQWLPNLHDNACHLTREQGFAPGHHLWPLPREEPGGTHSSEAEALGWGFGKRANAGLVTGWVWGRTLAHSSSTGPGSTSPVLDNGWGHVQRQVHSKLAGKSQYQALVTTAPSHTFKVSIISLSHTGRSQSLPSQWIYPSFHSLDRRSYQCQVICILFLTTEIKYLFLSQELMKNATVIISNPPLIRGTPCSAPSSPTFAQAPQVRALLMAANPLRKRS